jgi:hypothetical protein
MLAVVITACRAAASTFYVAPNGSDANPGTDAKPFATLGHARDEIRRLRHENSLADSVTVQVGGGAYHFSTSLAFDARDSGSDSTPVVWQAQRGAEVRLSGGIVLQPADWSPVTGAGVLNRLEPAVRNKIWQVDLRKAGVGPVSAYPDSYRGAPLVPELFFNDQRMAVAGWPKSGWATILKIDEAGSIPSAGDKSGLPGVFEYEGERPARWDTAAGVWLQGFWCYDWYEETIRVRSIDPAAHRITLAKPAHYGLKALYAAPRRFRALNVMEELDEPGEYYIDTAADILYFYPPGDLAKAHIELSVLRAPVLSVHDASNLVFKGFIVENSLSDGIAVQNGSNVRIESGEVRNTRLLGVKVEGGSHNLIARCAVHDTGTGGIELQGGDRRQLIAAGHEALNNHIWRFSQHQLTYASAITLEGVGNRAAHNLIHDAPHIAISIEGNDHVFEYNIVHDVCTSTNDAGALYKGRNPSCRGNIIRYNFWRDIGSPMANGTAAIYFDDGDGGDLVLGNVFLRSGHAGKGPFGAVYSNGGHDIMAENNIFIDCDRALGSVPWDYAKWKEYINGGHGGNWPAELLREVNITKPPYLTHYPELRGFMDPQPGQIRINRAWHNLFVRCGNIGGGNWKIARQGNWATELDPGFVNASQNNYQLQPNSPVFIQLPGFQPIPFDKIGLAREP